MAGIPSDGDLTGTPSVGEYKAALAQLLEQCREMLSGGGHDELIIASGVITATKALVIVDTESSNPTDNLDRISPVNHIDGRVLFLRANTTGRTVVLKHLAGGSGQFQLSNAADASLDSSTKWICLAYRESTDRWVEVFRSWTIGGATGLALLAATDDATARVLLGLGNAALGVVGSGNGLDADLLDGQHGSHYLNAGNLNAGTVPDARLPSNARGTRTVSTSAPSGGNNGDIWYQI